MYAPFALVVCERISNLANSDVLNDLPLKKKISGECTERKQNRLQVNNGQKNKGRKCLCIRYVSNVSMNNVHNTQLRKEERIV